MNIFNPQVTQSGDTITVTYCHDHYSGTCVYNKMDLQGRKFKQKVYILTHTDMGDMIECMYKMGEISGEKDMERVSMMIRTHSRGIVEDYGSRP